MKTRSQLLRALPAFLLAAVMLFAAGCGGNAGQAAGSTPPAADSASSAPEQDAPAAEPEPEEPEAQGMDIEQYKEMAAKFAFFCDSVYFDYQGDRGTVTILDIQVEEDTESRCRITVYYQEPALVDTNSWTDATDGYMTFAIDKATSQGTMECWEFLGVPGDYLPETVDQMDVAVGYSGQLVEAEMTDAPAYELEDIYDFAAGNILYASGEFKSDANAYWNSNQPAA